MSRDKTVLLVIQRELSVLLKLTSGMGEADFLASEKDQRAVMMTLLNIGELVKQFSSSFRNRHQEVMWTQIAGLRDIVAHTYYKINMERVWITVTNDIPVFTEQIESLISV